MEAVEMRGTFVAAQAGTPGFGDLSFEDTTVEDPFGGLAIPRQREDDEDGPATVRMPEGA